MVIGYGIWLARNKRIFQRIVEEPEETLDTQLHDLYETRRWSSVVVKGPVVAHATRWTAPGPGVVKTNCDVAVSMGSSGIGVIAHNNAGEVLFIGAKQVQSGAAPIIADAEAIWWAVVFACDLHFPSITIESNSLVLVSKLKKRVAEPGVLGAILAKIHEMSKGCGPISWSFVKRLGNEAANLLAHLKHSHTFVDYNLDSFPVGLLSIVNNDLA